MMRRRCLTHGHVWPSMPPIPVQFCARWFCDGKRVNPGYPMSDGMRAQMETYLNRRIKYDAGSQP